MTARKHHRQLANLPFYWNFYFCEETKHASLSIGPAWWSQVATVQHRLRAGGGRKAGGAGVPTKATSWQQQ